MNLSICATIGGGMFTCSSLHIKNLRQIRLKDVKATRLVIVSLVGFTGCIVKTMFAPLEFNFLALSNISLFTFVATLNMVADGE